jgi:hypothetical protein
MTSCLYEFFPVEIVWKIYDALHKSYMNDLNKEFLKFSNYTRITYEDNLCYPLLSHIKGKNMNYICWTDEDIKDALDMKDEDELTDEIRNQFYNELYDDYDNSFFNQRSQFGGRTMSLRFQQTRYELYDDYDDFRFNNNNYIPSFN